MHHKVFANLEERGLARVTAACDPGLERLDQICDTHCFVQRGVATYKDFDEMIKAHCAQMDLGVIAAPIQFHAPMHEVFVRNRAACFLEKPPTLDPEEFQRMLVVEEQAVVPTNVGFGYIHIQERLALKRRMLSGEFGALKRMSFLGLVQRAPSYYQRNNWAGKLMLGGNLLLDSCLGNAMAHFVNSMLFYGNQSQLQEWARPVEMACEMYRANPIEGTDTIFAIGHLDNGVELRMAASHACPNGKQITEERMEFEHATITILSSDTVIIEGPGMRVETFSIPGASLAGCVEHYIEFLRGNSAVPAQTLRDCLGFVETNALFYLAGGQIHDLPPEALSHAQPESAIVLPDMENAGRRLIAEALLPSQAGFSWAKPGGKCTIQDLPKLSAVVLGMRSLRY